MSHSGGGFSTWQNNTHPQWWKDPGLRKNVGSIALLYWCVFAFGYDGSLLAGLQGLKPWQEFFNHPKGSTLGLISAAYYFPKIGMPPIVAWTNDRFGRKIPILIGAILTCIGGIVCCFSNSVGMLIGGRVILGAGYSYHAITAAPLIGEIAHPRIRAIAASGFLATYYVGSVVAAWLCYGMTQVSWKTSNWTWRLPCLLQVAGPFIVIIGWFFLPESPRYYMEIGEEDKAIAYYEKYHANGTSMEQDELVRNEVAEIRESIVLSGKASTTPYSTLFKTPGNRKRVFIFLTVAMGTQLSGNGIVSFYLPSILKLIGITSPPKVGAINGGLAIMNLFVAIFAATQVERLGRRKLWIAGVAGMLVSLAIVGGLSGAYNNKASVAIGSGVIAFLYIFYAFYDISFTALPYLYVPEILPFAIRSKGMAVYNVVQCTCIAFNQYVNPIALDAIAWKYYFVYVAFLGVVLGIMIVFFPETKGKTPEEIAFIFDKTMPAEVLEDEHVSSNVSFNHDSKDKIGAEHQEELVSKSR